MLSLYDHERSAFIQRYSYERAAERYLTSEGKREKNEGPEGPEKKQQELGLQMIRGLALRMMKGWAADELEPVFARA